MTTEIEQIPREKLLAWKGTQILGRDYGGKVATVIVSIQGLVHIA